MSDDRAQPGLTPEEDRELAALLAPLGLPDDLPEVALLNTPGPDPEAVERIRRGVVARALADRQPTAHTRPVSGRRWRRWGLTAAVATVLVAAAVVGVAGPTQVLAQVRRVLSFVPGIGLKESTGIRLAAAHPVRVLTNGGAVEVRGLLVEEGQVTLHLYAENVPALRGSVGLEDASGHRMVGGVSSLMGAEGSAGYVNEVWASFSGSLPPDTRALTVVLPGTGGADMRIPVPLVAADALAPEDQFGPSATVNGYTIAAQVTAYPDQTATTLLIRGGIPGSTVTSVGRYFGADNQATRPAVLQGAGSADVRLVSTGGANWNGLFQLKSPPLPTGVTGAHLSIPALEVTEPGEARVTLALVTGPVDKVVHLGRWDLRLTRSDWDGKTLRLYVDLGPAGSQYLAGFGQMEGPQIHGWHSFADSGGRMEFFGFEPPADAGSVVVKLGRPTVVIEGPWQVSVPVQR